MKDKKKDSLEQLGNGANRSEDSTPPSKRHVLDSLFPRHIGRYELIYPISQGGMASVFAGRLTGLAGFQKLLAIKIIHPHLSSETNFIEMFLDEARLAAGIQHPNVGEVIEVGEDNGLYFMVCELVSGQSLRDFRDRAKKKDVPIPLPMIARIISRTAQALQAAHDLVGPAGEPLNLVHRDISPRNILISYDGFVKLIDFGVAYAQGRITHTEFGTLKGKVGYMSPEQIKARPIDGRSDIFSLGVVLYELATGQSPFVGNTDVDRLFKIVAHDFEPPRRLVADMSENLERIILKAMAFKPENRYATAAAMSADLEAYIQESKEAVDTGQLSAIMHSLFGKERMAHLAKVQASGKSIPMMAPVSPVDELTKPMPIRPVLNREDTTAEAASSSWLFIPVSKLKPVLLVAAGVLLVGLIAVPIAVVTKKDESGFRADSPKIESQEKLMQTQTVSPHSEVVISLKLFPPDAKMTLDGKPIAPGTPSLRLSANGESHGLKVFAAGYSSHEEVITADTDQSLIISLSKDTSSLSVNDSAKSGGITRPPSSYESKKRASRHKSLLLEKSPYQQ